MSRYYLYIDQPAAIFKARVNMPGAITYPITSLLFDGVTTGAYTDIQADMLLLLGSTDGGDEYGRVRVQNIATSTAIPLGRTSEGDRDGELCIVDNAYITVLDDYRVWSKIPYIDDDGNQYKDTTVLVGNYTSTGIPPVANCGPSTAGTIDSGTSLLTVDFDGSNSFAVADGATIDTYAWDVGGGTITVGTSADAAITATFPAGRHVVALTVTDDNGVPHTARCVVFARDPDDDDTIQTFDFETTIEASGQEVTIHLFEPVTFADGALVMIWEGEPFNAADRGHLHFVGWHQSDDASSRAQRTGNVTATTLRCVDVTGRLKTLPGFSQSLERAATITNWDKMTTPTMDKYVHYLLQWHSTALSVADYTPSGTGDDYPFVIFASEGESLFDQVENDVTGLVPTYHLTCNRQGQLFVNVDPMLQDAADRTSNVIGAFNEANLEEIRFTYTRPPRVHWLRGHALLTATGYTDVDGTDTLLTVHCIAPGDAPGQGVDAVETNEGLTRSQAALNNAKGHEYARRNSRYGRVTVVPPDDSVYIDVEPAEMQWVTLTLTAATAAQRGLTFATTRCLVERITRRVQARETGSIATSEFTLEVETVGKPAVTVVPVGTSYNPYVPTTPPSLGLVTGAQKVAGISSDGMLYTTSDFQTVSGSGGPTWAETDLSISDTVLFSFVVDPFSPGYINMDGTGEIAAYVVGDTNIWRVEDLFGTPSASIVHTFSTTVSGSSVFVSRTIGASFGRYFATDAENPWLLVISHYANASGHTGTWATYSLDAGVTWATEVQITEHYDTDVSGNDPANIPMLYMSPRTPGYAISAAYTITGSPASAKGYKTTDWGQTWTQMGAYPDSAPQLQPTFFEYTNGAGFSTEIGPGPSAEMVTEATATGSATVGANKSLMVALPVDTARCIIQIDWSSYNYRSSALCSTAQVHNTPSVSGLTRTGSSNFSNAPYGTTTTGTYTFEWNLTTPLSNDWPLDRETYSGSPPTSAMGVRINPSITASAAGGGTAIARQVVRITVTEIELDDGTTYDPRDGATLAVDPGQRLGGDLHIPWEDNSAETIMYYGAFSRASNWAYSLVRAESDGTTLTDISPTVSSRAYGINRYGFAIRAYDSDRQKVLVCGRGNGATSDTDDDYVGVFVSSDAGDTLTEIVSVANSTAAYSAAFGGDDSDIIFIWGPAETISYSSNFGAAIDSRAGNLSTFSPAGWIGIAGGPVSA